MRMRHGGPWVKRQRGRLRRWGGGGSLVMGHHAFGIGAERSLVSLGRRDHYWGLIRVRPLMLLSDGLAWSFRKEIILVLQAFYPSYTPAPPVLDGFCPVYPCRYSNRIDYVRENVRSWDISEILPWWSRRSTVRCALIRWSSSWRTSARRTP